MMRDPGPTNFLESNALLFAQAAQWTEMHDVLDELSPNELRSLYHAADRLRLTIWDRLSRPNDMGRNGPVPDPRKHRTYNVVPEDGVRGSLVPRRPDRLGADRPAGGSGAQ